MNHKNPNWWTNDHDSRWDKVKTAFRRDWEQTRNDFGSDTARDLQQSAADTVKQATGRQPTYSFDDLEPAFRYGYGAQHQHKSSAWDDSLESTLRSEYGGDYTRDRDFIRRGYEYRGM